MSLGKEYKFVKDENFEEFVQSWGLPEEETKVYKDYRPTQKLTLDGDIYTFTTTTPIFSKTLTFKSGVEFIEKCDRHDAKTTITVDGNVMTHIQKFEDGNVFTYKRVFTDDDLILTITTSTWDGVTKIYYKA